MPVWIRTQAQTMVVEVGVVSVVCDKKGNSIVAEPANDPQTSVELAKYSSQSECMRAFGQLTSWIGRGGHGIYQLNSAKEDS
jgi:hypothetical protein